ncbi:MAG: hypothetical protein KDC26_13210, partial [Armatimonadetes bacterium]|nr:hypothetical protein [Armatimonadota bacterium]
MRLGIGGLHDFARAELEGIPNERDFHLTRIDFCWDLPCSLPCDKSKILSGTLAHKSLERKEWDTTVKIGNKSRSLKAYAKGPHVRVETSLSRGRTKSHGLRQSLWSADAN